MCPDGIVPAGDSSQDCSLPETDRGPRRRPACRLIVLSAADPRGAAETSEKLARFMGIDAVEHRSSRVMRLEMGTGPLHSGERTGIVANVGELIVGLSHREEMDQFKEALLQGQYDLFLYGFSGRTEENDLLGALTEGALSSCSPVDGARRSCGTHFSCPVTGLHFEGFDFPVEETVGAMAFGRGSGSRPVHVMMTVEGKPFLVRVNMGESSIFIAGCHGIADVDEAVTQERSLLSYFPTVAPFVVFLREAFGSQCWHSPSPVACLIIDDPLLRMSYGRLNFSSLLQTLQSVQGCASIAFIPWNYRRSSTEACSLFIDHPERLSLTVHGCDHTRAEFGTADERLLRAAAVAALRRMNRHRELSGIPFDRIMVFPQGIFSTAAMDALRSSGYLAAVNTNLYPVDSDAGPPVLGELLDMALTRFADFPLFVRHYTRDFPCVVFDLFLGKPALMVEHHGYFRDGCDAMGEIVARLNGLDSQLRWNSLGTICSRACLMRVAEDDSTHVRFYTDTFRLRNDADYPRSYTLFRRVKPATKPSVHVTVNGQGTALGQDVDILRISLTLGASQEAEIKVVPGQSRPMDAISTSDFTHTTRVLIRRLLCELRDNFVDRESVLTWAASHVRSLLGRPRGR